MLESRLRYVDPKTCQRAQWVRAWRRSGRSADLRGIDGTARLIAVPGGTGADAWQVLLRPRDWLVRVFPTLDELLPEPCTDEQALALFCAAREPLRGEPPGLRHAHTGLARLVSPAAIDPDPLPHLETSFGPLWLSRHGAPPAPVHDDRAWLADWPVALAFTLGSSQLPSRDVAGLAVGDVLVIELQRRRLTTAGRCVGRFSITDSALEIDMTLDQQTPAQAPEKGPEDVGVARADLPMELCFVLQESVMPLAELAAFDKGDVVPLQTGCERAVRVLVNGRLLAEGELVRWGEGLGVELHTLHRGGA